MTVDRKASTGTFIVLSGTLLALVLTVACVVGFWTLYRDELARSHLELQRLSLALAEQTALAFQEIDSIIKEARQTLPAAVPAADAAEALHGQLRHRFHGLLQGQALMVFGPDGRMRANSRVFPTPDVTVTDREYFRVQRDADADNLFISNPLRNRVNANWMISLSRRLHAPDGDFGGVIMAAVDLDYFIRLYRSLDLPPEARLRLQRTDGTVLATFPFDEGLLGTIQPACADAAEFIGASSPVKGLPLSLCLTVPQTTVLRRWHALAWMVGPGVLAAVAGIVAMTGTLLVRARRDKALEQLQRRALEEQVSERTDDLREALDFNATVLAASPVGLAVYRQDGQCVSANAVFCRIMGCDREELLARNWEGEPFWQQGQLLDQARRTLAGGEASHWEGRVVTTGGQDIRIDWQCVRFSRQTVHHLLFLLDDITERKRAEEALQESETKFRGIVDTVVSGVILIDASGKILYANKRMSIFFGYAPDAIIGVSYPDLTDGTQTDEAVALLGSLINGASEHIETDRLYRRQDGTTFWGNFSGTRMLRPDGSLWALVGVITDISERKLTEEALQEKANDLAESETRFRKLFEMSPYAILVFEEDRFIDCNAATLALLGLQDKSEVVGRSPADLSPALQPDGRASDEKAATIVIQAYEVGSCLFEWEHIRTGGEHFLAEVTLTRIFHRERKMLHVVWRDITEQKLAQSMLAARMRLSELAGGSTTDEIMRFALDEAEALTGSTIGFFHFLDDDQVTLHLQAWSTNTLKTMCTAEGAGQHYPVAQAGVWADSVRERRPVIHNDYPRLPTRKGLPPGHASVIREMVVPVIRDARIDLIMGVGNKPRDYTQKDVAILSTFAVAAGDVIFRKRAEEELRRMGALLTSMLLNLPLDFWARDLGQQLIIQSEISRSMWGDLRQTIMSEPSTLQAWGENNARALAGEIVENEQAYTLPSGETVYLQERIAPIRKDDTVIGIMGVNVDLTPYRVLERQLRASKEAAEAASKSKSEFLANMSHEIRTPLNGILGMLQLMETTRLDGEQYEYLHAAIASCRRLTSLLSDILDLSRIEAGRLTFQEAPFSVAGLREAIMEVFSLVAKDKGLDLAFQVGEGMPPRLIGDEARLRQILFNLVGNALKFTESGHVWVAVHPLPSSSKEWCRALFTVEDTGLGIADDRVRDIFEPFIQGDASNDRRHQGAGLGLSIVRRLIKLMGGELAVDNREAGGTTFYLSLPLRLNVLPVSEDTTQPAAARSLEPSRLRVLLAEDEKVNQLALRRMLEKSGHAVVTAGNGQDVLRLVAENDVDCILMDIQMPVMDGLQTCQAIRESEADHGGPRLPIIAMTAYAMTGDREKFLAAGMDGYISKPVEISDLKDVLARVMARSVPSGNRLERR